MPKGVSIQRRWGMKRAGEGGAMGAGRIFGTLIIAVALLVAGTTAEGAKWSRTYIRQLPDSAFAAIERTPEGKAIRHLPHHDAGGNLDIPHLCNALSRLTQVKWRDPANAEAARRHLEEHLQQVGRTSCRPGRKAGDGG